MASIRHQLRIKAPAAQIFERLTTGSGIASWWDTPAAERSGYVEYWDFRPGPDHGVLRMKVVSTVPKERVEWECVSRHEPSSPASAWTDTRITFALEDTGPATVLHFRHEAWDEENRFYPFCSYEWAMALRKLKQECEASVASGNISA